MNHDTGALPGYLSQKQRVLGLFIYLAALPLASRVITGQAFPPAGQLLWMASAVGFLTFGLLSAPFFRAPKSSLARALSSALLLGTIDLKSTGSLLPGLERVRWISFSIAAFTAICAVVAILLVDIPPLQRPRLAFLSKMAYRISDSLGHGAVVFTPPALIGIIGFYSDLIQQFWLLFLWLLVVTVEPVELCIKLANQFHAIRRSARLAPGLLGMLDRIDDPNIVRVRLSALQGWNAGTPVIACLSDGTEQVVLPLFTQTRDSGLLATGLLCGVPETALSGGERGTIISPLAPIDVGPLIARLSGNPEASDIAGFVVENSNISTIQFEVAGSASLKQGLLVFCRERDRLVYYQILDARTAEETFERNPRGTHIVSAAQLGVLDDDKGFARFEWLPPMNSPVFLSNAKPRSRAVLPDGEFTIGTVPGSGIAVRVGLDDLIRYHAAVLGVTGRGKTELVFDIIRKALSENVKVFCVDFTGEYLARLSDCSPAKVGLSQQEAQELEERLFDVEVGNFSAAEEKKRLREFVHEIRPKLREQVEALLTPSGPALGIFQLEEIANTRATLRATELYLSSVFEWARQHRNARRVLIVLEEAHTVIPEMNLFRHDRVDTEAVIGRICQIALQGRKYGVGLLVVSQRTALVSKTVLSQCNTHFTFSLVDKTSLEYLASVYSAAHVGAIANLEFLQLMAFGKAIRSERPIVVQIPFDSAKLAASATLDHVLAVEAAATGAIPEAEETPETGSDSPS